MNMRLYPHGRTSQPAAATQPALSMNRAISLQEQLDQLLCDDKVPADDRALVNNLLAIRAAMRQHMAENNWVYGCHDSEPICKEDLARHAKALLLLQKACGNQQLVTRGATEELIRFLLLKRH